MESVIRGTAWPRRPDELETNLATMIAAHCSWPWVPAVEEGQSSAATLDPSLRLSLG